MSGEGNRPAQVGAGVLVLLIAATLMVGPQVVAAEQPRDLVLYVGAGLVVVGLWLVVPVGMGRIGEQARRMWSEFRGHG